MYDKELEFAKALAREAGEIMRGYFGFDLKREWKSNQTPLTMADTEINSLVIERIKEHFPGDSIHGEEESFKTDSNRLWVCDPVDGTMPFSHGLPISTFSLALVIDGSPVLGVIYDPFMDRLFYAQKNSGAFCNTVPIHVSDQPLRNALINVEAFPISGPAAASDHDSSIIKSIEQLGAKTTHLWSAIISFALVAAGQYTAALFNATYIHDLAAAKIIIEEAGGKTTDLFGNDQRYDQPTKGFIASNGVVHDELVKLFKK
jgi:fructose-1,6-bisphosphatase/inositol monophosphatase family enzyme